MRKFPLASLYRILLWTEMTEAVLTSSGMVLEAQAGTEYRHWFYLLDCLENNLDFCRRKDGRRHPLVVSRGQPGRKKVIPAAVRLRGLLVFGYLIGQVLFIYSSPYPRPCAHPTRFRWILRLMRQLYDHISTAPRTNWPERTIAPLIRASHPTLEEPAMDLTSAVGYE